MSRSRPRMLALLAVLFAVPVALLALPAGGGRTSGRAADSALAAEEPAKGGLVGATAASGGSWRVDRWGVTREGDSLEVLLPQTSPPLDSPTIRLLLIGGLDGQAASTAKVRAALKWFESQGGESRRRFSLTAIPAADVVGVRSGGAEPRMTRGFPPKGPAYLSPTAPESMYLWRWIGMHAPDLVIDVRAGKTAEWLAPTRTPSGGDGRGGARSGEPGGWTADENAMWDRLVARLAAKTDGLDDDELVVALTKHAPCDTDRIPALRFVAGESVVGKGDESGGKEGGAGEVGGEVGAGAWLGALLQAVEAAKFAGPSPARRTLLRRVAKSPREIATDLSKVYGHELKKVEYIPALALAGRVRIAVKTGDLTHLADVERIVEPYVKGEQPTTPTSGSGQSGHLIFPVLADASEGAKRERYVQLTRVAADQMFDREGRMLPSMPFHSEMSDALFMGGPILAAAGRLTGERKYFDACVAHLKFMQKLVWREDRIYRHSPLDDSAWGRGNGFPALGLTLCLSDFPADHPARGELIEMVRAHLRALLKHQDADGSWHQIIDRPESYREFTCTAMIAFSMRRGIDRGWLDESEFGPAAARGWEAVKRRIGDDGRLVDVCTGTGKMKSRREYYDREAILGRDSRGGAMALLIATEMLK